MAEIAGPIMLSVRGSEDPERIRFYVASTATPDDRSLLAEVRRDALEADPELFGDLKNAFYGHVERVTAESGFDMSTATKREYPGGLHGSGRPS